MSSPAAAGPDLDTAVGGPRQAGGRSVQPPRPPARRLIVECLAIGTFAVVLASWMYQVWKRSLSIPFENVYDARQVSSSIKQIIEHGLFSPNTDLGAPFGKQRFDWPVAGEFAQRGVLAVMAQFTDRFGLIMNTYFLAGFGVVAASAHAVLRTLRFSVLVAAVTATLYAFLPYHFFHGEGHLLRSAYYSAPLACLVMIVVLNFRVTLLRDPEAALGSPSGWRAAVRGRRLAAVLGVVAFIGVSETMVTFFTAGVIVLAGIVVAVRDRSAAVLVPIGAVLLTLASVFALALAPNFIYWNENGRNPRAVNRIPAEQELYGLRIAKLFVPIPNHRIEALREVNQAADERAPAPSEGGQQLGIVAALGLVATVGSLLVHGVARRSRRHVTDRATLLRTGGLISLLLGLMATISGLTLLSALAGFTEVRTWGRVVVILGFFGLLAVAVGLEWVVARLGPTRRALAVLVAVAVGAFGLWDAARPLRIDQGRQVYVAESMQSFVRQIEDVLPVDAAVFQLPVIPYPEYRARFARVFDYEELLPYLWSRDLRWSYGGTKGRPEADWQKAVDSANPTASLAGLVGLGFQGVMMDTFVYEDGGTAAMKDLVAVLGPPSIVAGPENRFRFWDLSSFARDEGLSPKELREAAEDLVGPRLLAKLPPAR